MQMRFKRKNISTESMIEALIYYKKIAKYSGSSIKKKTPPPILQAYYISLKFFIHMVFFHQILLKCSNSKKINDKI